MPSCLLFRLQHACLPRFLRRSRPSATAYTKASNWSFRTQILSSRSVRRQTTMADLHLQPSPSQAIDFLTLLQNLKVGGKCCCLIDRHMHAITQAYPSKSPLPHVLAQKTKRTGWVRKGVIGPESIADHMYRMGMMAFICHDSTVDTNRYVTQLATELLEPPLVRCWLFADASSWLLCMMLQKVSHCDTDLRLLECFAKLYSACSYCWRHCSKRQCHEGSEEPT